MTQFLQKVKLLSDELAAAGRPLNASDFNIYMFKGLGSNFKDIITTLSARPEPVSYSKLHSLLPNHEFIHGLSMSTLSLVLGDISHTLTTNIVQRSFNGERKHLGNNNNTSNRGRGRSYRRRWGRGGRNQYQRNNYGNNFSTMAQPWNSNNDGLTRCQICNGTNH